MRWGLSALIKNFSSIRMLFREFAAALAIYLRVNCLSLCFASH